MPRIYEGSVGTGAAFRAGKETVSEMRTEPGIFPPDHEVVDSGAKRTHTSAKIHF